MSGEMRHLSRQPDMNRVALPSGDQAE